MNSITVVILISALVATTADAEPARPVNAAHTSSIRMSLERVRFDRDGRDGYYVPTVGRASKNSPARKATAAFAIGFLGMLGGMYGGAWLGGVLGPEYGCETPPVPKGALIGMPIGGGAGAALGWRLAR
jgi:hypothetical protein